MCSKALLYSCRKFGEIFWRNFIPAVVCMVVLTNITGCGSNIENVDLPKDFIREFIAKHETMVDKSLVYYYVRSEQPEVAEQVSMACKIYRTKGSLESFENATFDFSGLNIELVDQKEEYINDEPVVFVKVAVKGSYHMRMHEATKELEADDIIVLQMAHSEWKVTNSNNPWS